MTSRQGFARTLSSIGLLSILLGTSLPSAMANFTPSNPGRPGNRLAGGVRGCVLGVPPRLLAMIPDSNLGYTTEAYPNFYAYLPNNTAPFVEFSLFKTDAAGENRELVYRSLRPSPRTAGIIAFELPEDVGVDPLAYGQDYQWSVALICDANNPRTGLRTLSWIERVTLDDAVAAEVAIADLSQQADLYAENGVWFNALESYITLQMENPDDDAIQQRWQVFLESVDLDTLVNQSVRGVDAE